VCGGSGQETVYELITYVGHGLSIRRREILQDVDQEKAKEFGAKLAWVDGAGPGDNQQIVTGARNCRCRRAA
jgi:hypothetical protein